MDTRYLYGSETVLSPAPHAVRAIPSWRSRVAENRSLTGQCSGTVITFPICVFFSHITYDKPSYRVTQNYA